MSLLKAVTANAPLEDIDRLLSSKSVLEVDESKRNALHIACQMDRLSLVDLLISKKVNVNAQDSNGWTPLHVAASNSNYSMCLALLNAKSIKLNTVNSDYNTALVYICKRSSGPAINRGEYHEVLRLFVDKGGDINTKNKNGETPLHYACLGANIDAVDFLLRRGANVNAFNNKRETSLHYAVRMELMEVVKKLLEFGADIEAVSSNGDTALKSARNPDIHALLTETLTLDWVLRRKMQQIRDMDDQIMAKMELIDAGQFTTNILTKSSDKKKLKRSTVGFAETSERLRKARSKPTIDTQRVSLLQIISEQPLLYLGEAKGWQCAVKSIECESPNMAEVLYEEMRSNIHDFPLKNIVRCLGLRREGSAVQILIPANTKTLSQLLAQRRLDPHLRSLEVREITRYAIDIIIGVESLHKSQIVHRNLKPSSVIMKRKQSKSSALSLDNFYLSKKEVSWPVCPRNIDFYEVNHYAAPELRSADHEVFDFPSDIWSFGLILFELITLIHPGSIESNSTSSSSSSSSLFSSSSSSSSLIGSSSSLDEMFTFQLPILPPFLSTLQIEDFSQLTDENKKLKSMLSLMELCLNTTPSSRPTATQVLEAMRAIDQTGVWLPPNVPVSSKQLLADLMSWPSPSRRDACPIKSTDHLPNHVARCDNFVIESSIDPNVTRVRTDPNSMIQFGHENKPYYKQHLSETPHENYVGFSDEGYFAIVSIETAGVLDDAQKSVHRAIIRLLDEDIRVLIVADSAKERSKALKQHPLLDTFKLERVKEPTIVKEMVDLEHKLLNVFQYKFGIVYRKKGQIEDDDMMSNFDGPPEYHEFLNWIGTTVQLKGWNKYRGGLDINTDTTGTHTLYASLDAPGIGEFEVLFHVATYLPYTEDNRQQLLRKMHIGNDIIVLVFQDEDADPFTPMKFASHFNHVFVVVQPISELDRASGERVVTHYKIGLTYKQAITDAAEPYITKNDFIFKKDDESRLFLLRKLINAERVALKSHQFATRLLNTRRQLISDLYEKFTKTAQRRSRRNTLF